MVELRRLAGSRWEEKRTRLGCGSWNWGAVSSGATSRVRDPTTMDFKWGRPAVGIGACVEGNCGGSIWNLVDL